MPQATLSLESATAGYEVGRVDFLTVLDNVVTLLTYQLEFYRQGADYMQAIAAMEEVADAVLPDAFSAEWTGITYQQLKAGNTAPLIFALSLVFVFLLPQSSTIGSLQQVKHAVVCKML